MTFCVEVHESFRGSFHRFHGSFHGSNGSLHESSHGRYGSFHGKKKPQASTEAFPKAPMEAASTKAFTEASMEVVGDAAEITSTEASTEAFTKAFTSTKASTEVLPRKLPRIRKLPRKHFHEFLGCSSMEASGSFHGRSEAQRLPRKVGSYIHGILRFTSMEAFAASTES